MAENEPAPVAVEEPLATPPVEPVEQPQVTPEQGLTELSQALDIVANLNADQLNVLMSKVPRDKLREAAVIKDELGRERQRLRSRQEYERDTGLSELREVEDLRRQQGEAETALAAALRSDNGIDAAEISRHVGRVDGYRKELVERETKVEIANAFDRTEEFEFLEDDDRARIRSASKRGPKDYLVACLTAYKSALERSLREKLVPEVRKQLEAEVGLLKELQGGTREGGLPPRLPGTPPSSTGAGTMHGRYVRGEISHAEYAAWRRGQQGA